MRILSVSLQNFASYEKLDFDFTNQGLTLIQGPTGSGKSTLCDAIPWVLFGKTAKGGAVDEIRPWGSKEASSGSLSAHLAHASINITRSRKPNDLYFSLDDGEDVRGKDITDTQRLINELLGLNYETYLAGAYHHEFSATAGFFTATAKNRRALIDQLVDLSFAAQLQDKLSKEKSALSKEQQLIKNDISAVKSTIEYAVKQNAYLKQKAETWELKRLDTLQDYDIKQDNFELDKNKRLAQLNDELKAKAHEYAKLTEEDVKALSLKLSMLEDDDCPTCGGPYDHHEAEELRERIAKSENSALRMQHIKSNMEASLKAIEREEASKNTWGEKIEELKTQVNPYQPLSEDLGELQAKELELNISHGQVAERLFDLEALGDITNDYRAVTIKNTVRELQDHTNLLLTNHFDAEIKVSFEVADADKLEVAIFRDVHECVYSQLSKGQRQLLKLCFGVSVMQRTANWSGVHYNALFFDEAFDGLDESLKIKAYGLLTTLATQHESIFVVEHSQELKSRFLKRYTVSLENGVSTINEEA